MKVFLGGTTNETTWRDELQVYLDRENIEYFNPVVKDWNEEAYQEELRQRETCDIVLYLITPKMIGVYSIAEVIDDSNKRPSKTLFTYKIKDGDFEFNEAQIKSLKAVSKMVVNNGGAFVEPSDNLYPDICEKIETLFSNSKNESLYWQKRTNNYL
jgi:hypothetical protein